MRDDWVGGFVQFHLLANSSPVLISTVCENVPHFLLGSNFTLKNLWDQAGIYNV